MEKIKTSPGPDNKSGQIIFFVMENITSSDNTGAIRKPDKWYRNGA